jgi:uncharacterized protein YuzB (UPF0349 family)
MEGTHMANCEECGTEISEGRTLCGPCEAEKYGTVDGEFVNLEEDMA